MHIAAASTKETGEPSTRVFLICSEPFFLDSTMRKCSRPMWCGWDREIHSVGTRITCVKHDAAFGSTAITIARSRACVWLEIEHWNMKTTIRRKGEFASKTGLTMAFDSRQAIKKGELHAHGENQEIINFAAVKFSRTRQQLFSFKWFYYTKSRWKSPAVNWNVNFNAACSLTILHVRSWLVSFCCVSLDCLVKYGRILFFHFFFFQWIANKMIYGASQRKKFNSDIYFLI